MRVAAITGSSGVGQDDADHAADRALRRRGTRVGAIKHTHHPLNEENRGDTAASARRRGAGDSRGAGEAVIFRASGTARVRYERPRDLLEHFDHDIVLIEGFKELGDWPKVSISDDARPTVDELAANLDRIWRS